MSRTQQSSRALHAAFKWALHGPKEFTSSHAADRCMCLRQEELRHASLPVNTVIESLRYGGVVSTGSHGTARDFGPMSDFIESMTIVDGRGQPVIYDTSHPHFNQARLSFVDSSLSHVCMVQGSNQLVKKAGITMRTGCAPRVTLHGFAKSSCLLLLDCCQARVYNVHSAHCTIAPQYKAACAVVELQATAITCRVLLRCYTYKAYETPLDASHRRAHHLG